MFVLPLTKAFSLTYSSSLRFSVSSWYMHCLQFFRTAFSLKPTIEPASVVAWTSQSESQTACQHSIVLGLELIVTSLLRLHFLALTLDKILRVVREMEGVGLRGRGGEDGGVGGSIFARGSWRETPESGGGGTLDPRERGLEGEAGERGVVAEMGRRPAHPLLFTKSCSDLRLSCPTRKEKLRERKIRYVFPLKTLQSDRSITFIVQSGQ